VREAVALLAQKTQGSAGLIIIDRHGRIGYARNTERMPVCFVTEPGGVNVDS
jgi:isoaspartyl peptidase/L-asparaginase-like protein (Ntn-hydrolase superfamily)